MFLRGIFSVLLFASLGVSGTREVPGDYPITTRTDSLDEFQDALTVTTLTEPSRAGSKVLIVADASRVDPRLFVTIRTPDGQIREAQCIKSVTGNRIKLSGDLSHNFPTGSKIIQASMGRERGVVAQLATAGDDGDNVLTLAAAQDVDILERIVLQSADGRLREAHCVRWVEGNRVKVANDLRNDFASGAYIVQGSLLDGEPDIAEFNCCCPGKGGTTCCNDTRLVVPRRIPTMSCTLLTSPVVVGNTVQVTAETDDPNFDYGRLGWEATGGDVRPSGAGAIINTAGLAAGTYTVRALFDDADHTELCAAPFVVLPKLAPSCEALKPTVIAGGSTAIEARTNRPDANLTYSWTIDGSPIAERGSRIDYSSAGLGPGPHTVSVRVDDPGVDSSSAQCVLNIAPCSIRFADSDQGNIVAGQTVSVALENPVQGYIYNWEVDGQFHSRGGPTASIDTTGMSGGTHISRVSVREGNTEVCQAVSRFGVIEKIVVQCDRCPDNIAKAQLDEIALKLQRVPPLVIRLTGHTDDTGTDEKNQQVGLRRANALKDYLVKQHGINVSRIQVASAGENQPIATNLTSDGRTQNRRVELELYVP